ncbi:MAG: cyclic peptide export ABC transporter [Cyanobacteria bacterium P01_F01_bin.13]
MKIFLFVIKKAPGLTILAMLTALLSGLFSGGLITLIHRSLDAVDSPENGFDQLGLVFALLIALTLISAIAANVVIAHLYRKVLLDLQSRLAKAITQAPLRKLEDIGSSSLLALFTEDIDNISDTATELVPLIINLVTSLVCCGYLLWLSWQAFLGTFIFLLFGGLSYQLLVNREQDILIAGREKIDHLYDNFENLTHGIKELKLNQNRCQAFLTQVLGSTARSVQRYMFIWDVAYSVISAWGRFLILMVIGLILFLLPKYLSLQTGTLTGYILALLYVRTSLLSVIDALPELSEAAVALRKVEAVGLDLATEEPANVSNVSDLSLPWQSLKLVNVIHRYYREREDDVFSLGPINLEFRPGELVFLVGGNGSGKTTLAKLICGLYTPESGEMVLDQVQICDRTRLQYSQLFSVVFTDFHLFDNLLGLNQPNLDARAKHYLAKLHLDHKVNVQDGKFSTTALSRGQQQRLALLSAYLEDRPFYIFDEWAANQDPIFKHLFYTEFLPELRAKGKTVLVISHDDHYFHLGDRTLKLIDGNLSHS